MLNPLIFCSLNHSSGWWRDPDVLTQVSEAGNRAPQMRLQLAV